MTLRFHTPQQIPSTTAPLFHDSLPLPPSEVHRSLQTYRPLSEPVCAGPSPSRTRPAAPVKAVATHGHDKKYTKESHGPHKKTKGKGEGKEGSKNWHESAGSHHVVCSPVHQKGQTTPLCAVACNSQVKNVARRDGNKICASA